MIGQCDNEKNVYVKQCKACGYAYAKKYNNNGYYEAVIGDKDFIELGLTIKKGYYSYESVSEERLYACPKCGTVHIEI
jgi:acetone carboxylase gamma subunit